MGQLLASCKSLKDELPLDIITSNLPSADLSSVDFESIKKLITEQLLGLPEWIDEEKLRLIVQLKEQESIQLPDGTELNWSDYESGKIQATLDTTAITNIVEDGLADAIKETVHSLTDDPVKSNFPPQEPVYSITCSLYDSTVDKIIEESCNQSVEQVKKQMEDQRLMNGSQIYIPTAQDIQKVSMPKTKPWKRGSRA
jgi:hypothetical protein